MEFVNKIFKRLNTNSKGLSLIELLVGTGIASIVLAGVSVPIFNQIKTSRTIESYFWLSQLRTEIVASLKKKSVLDATILNPVNSSLACLKPKTTNGTGTSIDCRGQGGPVVTVLDTKNVALIDNSSPNAGFDEKGQPCSNFSDSSESCPFKFELSWEPVCPPTDKCFNPDVKFEGKLIVSKAHRSPLNPDLYGFRWILPMTENSDVVCASLGIGSASSGNCAMKIETRCPAGQFLVGFDANGMPKCKVVTVQTCPAGSLLQGFDASGEKVCGSICH